MPDEKTLKEIARHTFWEPDYDIEENVITEALTRVGLDPSDSKERQRFRSLVVAAYHQEIAEDSDEYDDDSDEDDDG